MNAFSIGTPSDRARLEPREKPYFVRVTDAVHLGYKKGKSVCRWIVRLRRRNGYVSHAIRGAVPDDEVTANGTTVLSYEQALVRAMNVNVETTHQSTLRHCSFCRKPQTEVAILIAGPSTYICNECVSLCNGIIEEHAAAAENRAPPDRE
jgi:hypothetical protein